MIPAENRACSNDEPKCICNPPGTICPGGDMRICTIVCPEASGEGPTPTVTASCSSVLSCSACECPGDLNKDWIVDQQDLGALLAAYGTCEGDPGYNPKANLAPGPSPLCPSGIEGIDQADLGVLLANYGSVCP